MGSQRKYALIAVITLCVCVLAIYVHRHREGKTGRIDNFLIGTVGSLQGGLLNLGKGTRGVVDHYIFLVNASRENSKLQREVEELQKKIVEMEELKLENERLKGLLEFKGKETENYVAASVIAHDVSGDYFGIRINRGSTDGVLVGMGVISPQGVVGRVLRVAPHHADVLTLLDPTSSIDVIVQRSRTRGILSGQSKSLLCKLKYVDKLEDVVVGDSVVSSGFGGRFPKGLIVGHVISISPSPDGLLQNVTLKSAVDIYRLEEVFVVFSTLEPEKTT